MAILRSAKVFVQDRYAGIIAETTDGFTFSYDEDYLKNPAAISISQTMPLSNEEYNSKVLFPFFDGLIPEGWLLNFAIQNWKLKTTDRFGMLLTTCRDCIGDVSIEEVSNDTE